MTARTDSRFGIFGRSPAYRTFWSARTISLFGDAIANVALVLYIAQSTNIGINPNVAVGLLLLAQVVPRFLGPLAGTLADRIDQRRLMVLCDFAQVFLFGIIALLLPPFPILLGLVLATSLLATFFLPAGRSALPMLVAPDDLMPANALLATGYNLTLVLGPAIGGLIVSVVNIRAALLVDALTFVISVILLTRLPALPPMSSALENTTQTFMRDTLSGLTYLVRHRIVRAVAFALFLSVAFAAVDNVTLVFLARNSLNAGATGYGLLASVFGAGMILSPLIVLRWKTRLTATALLLAGILLDGLGTLLTGLAPFLIIAMITQCLAGAGNGFENVGSDTLIQQTVPRAMLGRVFGITYSGISIALGLAYAGGGALLTFMSPRMVFVLAGGGVMVVFFVMFLILPRS